MSELTEAYLSMAKNGVLDVGCRAQRVDARRNRESLLSAAREAFKEVGGAATVADIARRANVGIGTLYRHFPTREQLLESVYELEVEQLRCTAHRLNGLSPWDELVAYLHLVAEQLSHLQIIAVEMNAIAGRFAADRRAICAAGEELLQGAVTAGPARADVTFEDLFCLTNSLVIYLKGRDSLHRILGMALVGIHRRP
jgi:AcrR family transcriptional regulator